MTLDNILEEIKKAETIVIMAHETPDGDAIGSCLAMKVALKQLGKNADVIIREVPKIFDFLPGREEIKTDSEIKRYDLAISFLNPYKDLNNGFTTEQTIKAENSLLNKIKIGNTIQLYKHTGIFIKDITVDFISNESQLVTEADMQYKRFAVKDNSAPTPDIVDEFVEFIKNKPDDIHLHFHCAAGKGRTTSFMVMYQAMKNNSNLTLEQLLSYQYNIGGVNLHDNNIQYNFLEDFCNYVQKNKDSNYSISYSQWIKES
jgi:protein-tyrosine phosphatase